MHPTIIATASSIYYTINLPILVAGGADANRMQSSYHHEEQ